VAAAPPPLGHCHCRLPAPLLHLEDRIYGAGVADQRFGAGATQPRFRAFPHLPFRRCPFWLLSAIGRQAQAIEHASHVLRHDLAHDLGDADAEGDPAPCGIILRRIKPLIIRRHVLGAVARNGGDKAILGRTLARTNDTNRSAPATRSKWPITPGS